MSLQVTRGVPVTANPEPALASAPGFLTLHSWQRCLALIPVLTAAQANVLDLPRLLPWVRTGLGVEWGGRKQQPRRSVPDMGAPGLLTFLGAGGIWACVWE